MKSLLLIFASVALLSTASAKVVDRIVAIVNDQIVTQSDINSFRKKLKTKGLVDEALLVFYDQNKIKKNRKNTLNYLIDERLIDSEVVRNNIVAPIEKVEGEIRNIIRRTGTSRAGLKASLKKRGLRFSDYQDFIKRSIQRQTLLQREVSSKIKISDDDIASFYIQKSKNSKALVFEYELAHILFLTKNGGPEEAMKKAQEVRKSLNSGGNFERLASQHSEDPRFTQGGVFGEVKVGEIVPALENALKGKKPGDITKIVKMGDGLHIFKILKRKLSPSPEFIKAKPRIAEALFSQAFKRQYDLWIEGQRQTAYIKINK